VDASVKRLAAFRRPVIALSLSTVVEKKCVKQNIAYIDIMKAFTQYLLEKGYGIWMLANAAQASADTRRNNDLVLCRELYARFKDDPYVAFIDKEMEPEEIRSYLGHCRSLVGSRFHAMVFAYTKKIPVMLVGWSHKYREVGASLGVDSFTLDYKTLALSEMKQTFDAFDVAHDELRASLAEHLPGVIASAQKNVQIVIGVMEEVQL
jgi:polysaccharide pyruvyl transferase WcaK-like protein